jgi:hypothetical protein
MSSDSRTHERGDQPADHKPVREADWVMAAALIILPSFFLKSTQAGVAAIAWTAAGVAGLAVWAFLALRARRVGTASRIWFVIVTVAALAFIARLAVVWL